MKTLSRRTVLRGLGAAIALSWPEAMTPGSLRAASPATKAPTWMAFDYAPNGVHMPDWTPRTTGPGFDLPPLLEPLRPVREDLLALSGLSLRSSSPARGTAPGSRGVTPSSAGRRP